MKKFLLFAGLAAAALSFVGCNKEAEVRGLGKRTAELRLSTPDTRTVNDEMNTLWAEEDSLTVFYAPAGTTDWSENTLFVIDDPDAGLAKGDVELTADAYDWYLFYPYSEYMVNPTGKDDTDEWAGYFYVGSSSKGSQTQDGLNSMEHIAGERVPLVGRVTDVAADQTPEVTMKHLSTLLKIDVINTYENPITIKKISFTAPTDIVGSAYLDFSGAEPNLVPSEGHIGKTAQLTVKDADPLATSTYASFYLAVMPFSVEYGDVMTMEVVASEGTYTAEVTATDDYTFEAGHMKTLNVYFELEAPTETMTVTEAIAAQDESTVTIAGAIVAACSTKGFVITDGTSNVYVYLGKAPEVSVGDEVTLSATLDADYFGLPELKSVTFCDATSHNNEVPRTTLVELDKDNIDSYDCTTAADYISVTGVLEASSNYYNVRPAGAERFARTDYLVSSLAPSEEWVGKTVKMTGYFNTLHSTNNYLKVVVTEFELVDDGGQGATTTTTLTMTMNEYVDEHECETGTNKVYSTLYLSESVRMSTSGDPNCGAFFGTTTHDWRLYQQNNGDVTISVADGCELESVTLTYNTSNGGTLFDGSSNQIKSKAKNIVSGSSVTYTVGNTGDATNGQVRITAVEIVYTGEGTFPDAPEEPTETTTQLNIPYNATVYVGETFDLEATTNVDATITYESEDISIATVDADGVITGVAEGTVKVYARIEAVPGVYTAAERYCNVTVTEKPDVVSGTWESKALASIADGTQVILVSTNAEGGSYAMSNGNGTGSAPTAVAVTVSGDTITDPESNIIFVLNKTADGFILKKEDGETWVYCLSTNNGIRVGTNEHNLFNVDAESGYLVINDGTQDRYLGVYNKADWRAYTSVNNNIKDQTFSFFVPN